MLRRRNPSTRCRSVALVNPTRIARLLSPSRRQRRLLNLSSCVRTEPRPQPALIVARLLDVFYCRHSLLAVRHWRPCGTEITRPAATKRRPKTGNICSYYDYYVIITNLWGKPHTYGTASIYTSPLPFLVALWPWENPQTLETWLDRWNNWNRRQIRV